MGGLIAVWLPLKKGGVAGMAKKNSFEGQLDRLKEIVEKMEDGSILLDDALKLFEEGIGIYASCNALLDNAEQKIKVMTDQGEEDFSES